MYDTYDTSITHDINQILRLSMNEQGDIFYSPVVYVQDFIFDYTTFSPILNITFEDDSRYELPLELHLTPTILLTLPVLRFIDGVPVVSIRTMHGWPDPNDPGIEIFMSFVEELRDEPVIVVDVRGNGGGNGLLPLTWLYELTGSFVPHTNAMLSTRLIAPRARTGPFGLSHFDDNHSSRLGRQADNLVVNHQLIIMLTDRRVGSAAELFTDSMLNMGNTLIVGQNTRGMLITGEILSFATHSLPNSGIPFTFGVTLSVFPEGLFAEGIGLAPDIWVHGDALQATLSLLRNR